MTNKSLIHTLTFYLDRIHRFEATLIIEWSEKSPIDAAQSQRWQYTTATFCDRRPAHSVSIWLFTFHKTLKVTRTHCLDLVLNGLLTRRNFWRIPGMLESYTIPKWTEFLKLCEPILRKSYLSTFIHAHGRSQRHILDKITKWHFLSTSNKGI